jgi:hypothetical protein
LIGHLETKERDLMEPTESRVARATDAETQLASGSAIDSGPGTAEALTEAPGTGLASNAADVDSYSPPLRELLTLGEAELNDWPDHLALGIVPEHIPGLVQILQDTELQQSGRGR